MALNFKDEVLVRIYTITALLVVPVMIVLMYRTVDIAVINRAKYQQMGKDLFQERTVAADRGNIYSRHDNLLATSVPYFSLHFDPFVAAPKVYYDNIDSLAFLLSRYVDADKTPGLWRQELLDMRDSVGKPARHYYQIAESVSYRKLRQIQEFPIFNLGQMRGGLIVQKRDERKRPFGWLARRTIGKPTGKKPGLEGAYDEALAGVSGKAMMFNSRGVWIPTENLTIVEPRAGADLHTTLDVNIQDIAENALHRAVRQHLPDWGTAIVMDVETGAIRAMANLGYADKDRRKYIEQYNYAISQATEPGSTFKLATMMALLEDKKITLDSEVDIHQGEKTFDEGKVKVTDSNPLSRRWNKITVRQAFEQSSNVAMAVLADSLYRDGEFSARLQSFHLDKKTGLSLAGEAQPVVNDTSSTTWSGISNAWLSFGYESRLTPLQMLTFFNAVANNGRMMKPYLVEEIRRDGRTEKKFKPTVIDAQLASQRTIESLQSLMEGVVERGTAKKLRSDKFRFAGKTGTSQQGYGHARRRVKHQASFAGYFPAERPRYSIIVVVFNPTQGSYYGGEVAGPVFREIATNIYNSMIDVHAPLNQGPRPVLYARQLPNRDAGYLPELAEVLNYVNVDIQTDSLPASELAVVEAVNEEVTIREFAPRAQAFPNVRGMRLRDAVYVLENEGFVVHPQGVGRVTDQKWHSDGRGKRGKDVTLFLK